MRIDLQGIDRERFYVDPREHAGIGTLVLVRPRKQMWDWRPGEEWLRSLLCREDGTVVSSGFPKFYNYGENPAADARTDDALARGLVRFVEKVDGSLIIRTVVDGVIIWRTRGAHGLGEFEPGVMRVARGRYPALLDPSWDPEPGSWLFEYVDADAPICLRYERSDLRTLGFIRHTGAPQILGPAAAGLAWCGAPPPPRSFDLPRNIAELREAVGGRQDEGVVAWCGLSGGYHLAKFKSRRYLLLHSIRSNLTERRALVYIASKGIVGENHLRASFEADGIDWEVGQEAVRHLATYHQRLAACGDAAGVIMQRVGAAGADRKSKALAARAACDDVGRPEMFAWAIALATDDPKAADLASAVTCGLSLNEYRNEVARLSDLTAPVADSDAA